MVGLLQMESSCFLLRVVQLNTPCHHNTYTAESEREVIVVAIILDQNVMGEALRWWNV